MNGYGDGGNNHEGRISRLEARADNIGEKAEDIQEALAEHRREIAHRLNNHADRLTAQERFKSQLLVLWGALVAVGTLFAETIRKALFG